jgi:4-hydroxy-3-polyprenylbenzoate decarboxylase
MANAACPLRRLKSCEPGPADVLDHATSEIASGSKLGIDATKKMPGEGFKRPWPPLIKMDAAVKAKVEELFKQMEAR